MIKNIFFDLDGTLLPMEQENFMKAYFTELCNRVCPVLHIQPEILIKGVWKGTEAMVKNDGSRTNLQVFWESCSKICGKDILTHISEFDDFYNKEFLEVQKSCGYNPLAPETVKVLKQKGYRLFAATNPLFPTVGTYNRLKWAGVKPSDFEIVTTYENSSYCKPNPKYYEEIMEKANILPEETMMIGNDIDEDIIPTQSLGMSTYLVTDCLINKKDVDYSNIQNGSLRELLNFVRMMPDVRK